MLAETLARGDSDGFDIALRRRGEVIELIVNGIFAMDSAEVASEVALADLVDESATSVLVGGLGLGFTAARLLDRTAARLTVVELSADLIAWARAGLTPELARVAGDARVTLVQDDIARHLPDAPVVDAVLLDVDNGPDFLIHDQNADLYAGPALAVASGRVAPGGVLAVWSEGYSSDLDEALRSLGGTTGSVVVPVQRGDRRIDYAIHTWRPRGVG